MSQKTITVVLTSDRPGMPRYAIDYRVDEREVALRRNPGKLITIRVGFESITMSVDEFIKLLSAVDAAEASGAEYPDDWKDFYGLGDAR